MDLLSLIQKLPFAPPLFNEAIMDKFGAGAVMPETSFPKAPFASKRFSSTQKSRPQIIAHRGYKLHHPENTLPAFEAAVEAGAHALETDLHLSKDGVVVLSHDPELKRCFGVDRLIKDCDWSFLQTLRTIRAPHEPLSCLQDLLELFLRKEGWDNVWLLLDIKFYDDPTELVRSLSRTFKQVDPEETLTWKRRVLLGYWTAKYVPLYHEYFPGYSIINIGFSISYCRQYFAVPGSDFSMTQASLVSPSGRNFIRDIQANHRHILCWTVNDEKAIDWCIRRGLDGILTDNVPQALEMCERYNQERRYRWSLKTLLGFVHLNIWIYLFGVVFRRRYGTSIHKRSSGEKKTL